MDMLKRLACLVSALKQSTSLDEKIEHLNQDLLVRKSGWETYQGQYALVLKSLAAIGQLERLSEENFDVILEDLEPVEHFYREIGGIVGYHFLMLCHLQNRLVLAGLGVDEASAYTFPQGIELANCPETVIEQQVADGLMAMAVMAEMYPVGGAADRLRLSDPVTQTPMPAARLRFGGKTLLEWMIEDLQGREYLYYQRYGQPITVPIAMMTSSEKDNHAQILALCEEKQWFGRPKESFFLFCQPLVPVVDREGNWAMTAPGKLLLKPGGHGAIWKLARDQGVFDWLKKQNKTQLIVRQINNPIAGCDGGLLALSGIGFKQSKSFGFASCQRQVYAAEGMNVLVERQGRRYLTCVEYCDFPRLGLADVPVEEGSLYSKFPSNTNVLFANIDAILKALELSPLPGMIVNFKPMTFLDAEGRWQEQEMARLESTMQNIADCFEEDRSFLTYNHRQKTISAIKREWDGKGSLLETPEGCYWDFYCNAQDLLQNYCHFALPPLTTLSDYRQNGSPYQFWYHPSLGPIYSIIAKKLRRGKIATGSELRLHIAQLDVEDLDVSGRLCIHATHPMGVEKPYSLQGGRCRLYRVRVENRSNERCEIILNGDSECEAADVVFRGPLRIEVPTGCRLVVTQTDERLEFCMNGVLQYDSYPQMELL